MRRSLLLLCWTITTSACGDDDDTAGDGDADADSDVDAGGDADAGADAEPGSPGCAGAEVIVAGTEETDALATAPARCGMAAHSWMTGPELGEVVSRTEPEQYTVGQLEDILAAAGLGATPPLEHDISIETVAYTTQDRGGPVESSTLLAIPTDVPADTELPVLLLLHGTSGFTRACGSTSQPVMQALSALFASLGWITVAPDYLGLESVGEDYPAPHPYLIGEPTAIASLDAVRAARRAVRSGDLCASTHTAIAGASQGGHAALWVERLAPYYARELDLIGTVAWVPATDIPAHVDRGLGAITPITPIAAAILATQPVWYGLGDRLDEAFLPPWDTDLPAAFAETCIPEDLEVTALEDIFQPDLLATVAGGSSADFDPFGCPLEESSLLDTSISRIGPTAPEYGILFVVGGSDDLVSPEIERPAYDALCAEGLPLQYLECEGAGHVEGVLWSLPEAASFLDDRRAGVAFEPACERPAAQRCLGTP